MREKIEELQELLAFGEIDELDMFSVLSVMAFGFYCDIGKEKELLNEHGINEPLIIDAFKKTNTLIHNFTINDLINVLLKEE